MVSWCPMFARMLAWRRGLPRGFSFNMGDTKCLRVWRRTKLPWTAVHSDNVREIGDESQKKLLLLIVLAILNSRAYSLHSHVILLEWLAFYSAFFFSFLLTALTWRVPHETAAVSAQVLCTPYNHAPCHFMKRHIRKVYACLAVTWGRCHLHFWQNDRERIPM